MVVPEKVLQWIDNSYRTAITQDGKMIVYSWQGEDLSSTDFFYCFIDQIGTPDFQWYEVEKVN